MQICFNRSKCPLLRKELSIFQRILWITGYWVCLRFPSAFHNRPPPVPNRPPKPYPPPPPHPRTPDPTPHTHSYPGVQLSTSIVPSMHLFEFYDGIISQTTAMTLRSFTRNGRNVCGSTSIIFVT